MPLHTGTALDQLNHIINTTFSSIEKVELFDQYTTLEQEFDCTRFVVGKLWNLKLQIHMIE